MNARNSLVTVNDEIEIKIVDCNDNPPVIEALSFTVIVDYKTPNVIEIGTIVVTDKDTVSTNDIKVDLIQWQQLDYTNNEFIINSNNKLITKRNDKVNRRFHWQRNILIRACNWKSGRLCSYQNISVKFEDSRLPATFISPKTFLMSESIDSATLEVYTYDQRVTHRMVKIQSTKMVTFDTKSMRITVNTLTTLPMTFEVKSGSNYEKIKLLRLPNEVVTDKVKCQSLPSTLTLLSTTKPTAVGRVNFEDNFQIAITNFISLYDKRHAPQFLEINGNQLRSTSELRNARAGDYAAEIICFNESQIARSNISVRVGFT